MISLDDINLYIEQNSYFEWNEEEWLNAERAWADFPSDSEEYKKLELLRKQRERKLSDEEKYQAFLIETQPQKVLQEIIAQSPKPEGIVRPDGSVVNPDEMIFLYKKSGKLQDVIDSIFGPKDDEEKCSFIDLLNEGIRNFEKKYDIYLSDAKLEERANLARGVVGKLKANKGTKNEDYLWALALALDFNYEKAEELFKSCQICIAKAFLNKEDEKRQRLIEAFLNDPDKGIEFNVSEVNSEIEERNEKNHLNMKLLGSKIN